jgi:hypothetical protein
MKFVWFGAGFVTGALGLFLAEIVFWAVGP